jgi:phosphatidylglycerophosphatase A
MFVIAFTLAGIWASDGVIPLWGDDPKRVVVDEMVGVWIALLGAVEGSIGYPIAAFCLFRFFDITKPLGIRRMEELHGGLGVMADDILAGVYALFVLLLYRSITI